MRSNNAISFRDEEFDDSWQYDFTCPECDEEWKLCVQSSVPVLNDMQMCPFCGCPLIIYNDDDSTAYVVSINIEEEDDNTI